MILNVRIRHPGPAADEATGFKVIAGAQTVLAKQPARTDQSAIPEIDGRVQGNRFLAGYLEIEFQMVLQVFTDSGQIVNDWDVVRAKFRRRTDAGKLQQLRRIDGTGGKDQFSCNLHAMADAASAVLQPGGASTLEQHARRTSMRQHLEAWTAQGRSE